MKTAIKILKAVAIFGWWLAAMSLLVGVASSLAGWRAVSDAAVYPFVFGASIGAAIGVNLLGGYVVREIFHE